MPETLFESRAIREFGPGSTLLSVGVHAVLITAALVSVTGKPRGATAVAPAHDVVWIAPTNPVHSAAPACRAPCIGLSGAPVVPVPHIPMPGPITPALPNLGSMARVGADDFGPVLPMGTGLLGGESTAPSAGEPWTADQVERVAVVLSAPEPRYPDRLREAGVSGRVVVRFVIDTTGRIEPASVAIVESTHELFERAVRDVLPRMRFHPASVGARRVRMLVEMPFEFRVRQ